MLSKINQEVQVDFNRIPRKIYWNNREYEVKKLGLHHKYRVGNDLFHVFSVAGENLFFRLVLDAQALTWNLEEIHDGL